VIANQAVSLLLLLAGYCAITVHDERFDLFRMRKNKGETLFFIEDFPSR